MENRLERGSVFDEFFQLFRGNIRQYTMIFALFIIWLTFTITTGGIFITPRNLSILFVQMCTTGILTGGMLLVMVSGNIDLAAGSVCGTLGALAAYLMTRSDIIKGLEFNPVIEIVIAIVITIIVGVAVGAWHGYWVAFRGVPAFIVTLASQIAFRGFTLMITNGATIGEFDPAFKAIGQDYIPDLPLNFLGYHVLTMILFAAAVALFIFMEFMKRKKRIENGFSVLSLPLHIAKLVLISVALVAAGYVFSAYKGIPYAIILLLVIVALSNLVTTRTSFGRHVYAIGGNKEAAKLSGVNIQKSLMKVFVIMGAMCGVASIVYTSRLNAATTAAGANFELDAIAACIIGGTSTSGGTGTAIGAIIGALVMASLDNGMSLMNLPIMIQYIVKGAILLLAVWVDIATKNKK